MVSALDKTEQAHANEQEKTITGLGTGLIGNPTDGETAGLTKWTGSYVYYGKYNDTPVKYRVLTTSTSDFNSDADNTAGRKTMLLDCDSTLYTHEFDNDSNVWADSTVKEDLNGTGFLSKVGAFTAVEKEAIAFSTKVSSVTGDGNGNVSFGWCSLSGEKIFLLDAKEATRPAYGYKNTASSSDTRKKTGAASWWWLRSPYSSHSNGAGVVDAGGYVNYLAVSNSSDGVSPAFNLNLTSVIFTSLINPATESTGAEYKLTVLDKDLAISVTDGQQVTVDAEGNFSVPYTISGNNKEKANRVSVLILDHPYIPGESVADTEKFDYIKLNTTAPFSTSGTGTFRLPEKWNGKKAGIDYYIYILAEEVHTDDRDTDIDESKLTDYASSPVSLFPITGLGTGLIGNPTDGETAGLTKWTGSYVYYGKYNNTPVKYRVLTVSTSDFNSDADNTAGRKTMLLDCDSTLFKSKFDNNDLNVWAGSTVKKDLNGTGFLSKAGAFTAVEKEAIALSTKVSSVSGDGNGWDSLEWCSLSGEKIFLLDAKEATRPAYGYKNTDDSSNTRKKTGAASWWWLRSPYSYSSLGAGFVDLGGIVGYDDVDTSSAGVSPAFNLNLSSVIFSSLIPNTTDEYKLTVKDSAMTIALNGDAVKNGDTVTVPYSVTNDTANEVEATRVTVLFLDHEYVPGEAVVNTADNTKYAYIKLDTGASFSAEGTGTFEIPDAFKNKTLGTDYYIYLFAEEENGVKETDYASEPVEITHIHSFEYAAGTGENTNSVIATCLNKGCSLTDSKIALTIEAPAHDTYGDEKTADAVLSGLNAFNSATKLNISSNDIKYSGREGTTYNENTVPPVVAGKYRAEITVESITVGVDYEIKQREVTVSGIKVRDRAYNGTKTAELDYSDAELTGVVEADKAKIGISASGEFTDVNAGKNKTVNISNLVLTDKVSSGSGSVIGNYILAESCQQTEATAEIFKLDSRISEVPVAKTGLVYTGDKLELITKGQAENGTLVYAVTEKGAAAPSDDKYSMNIPVAVNVGEYTVYYKVTGDTNYNDIAATNIDVVINEASPKPQPDPIIPTPVVTPVPEEPDTGSKTVTNNDGSTTTTTKTKNEDGTITESTIREWKNGDKNITEVIKDADGNTLSTLVGTVRISKKGTKTERTDIKKADGFQSNSSVKTYKSGKEVSSSSTTFANGSKQAYTETKNADGNLTRKVMDTNTKGKSTLTVTTKNLVKTVTKYKVTGDGKIRLTSIKTEGDTAIIPKTVTFDGQKNMIVSLGKGLFKGMEGIKEIYIYAENLKKIYAGAFDGVPADAKFYIKATDANIKKIVRMIKKSGFGKVDYTKI